MTQEIENITAEQAFKSNANFEKYLTLTPPEVMTSTLDEFNSIGADLHVIRYELTQKVESLLGALNQVAKKESATPSFIVWVFANEKEDIMELTKLIRQNEILGIFVFKATLIDNKMDIKCLLKPKFETKKTTVSKAKQIQLEYWKNYNEICDELGEGNYQIEPKAQHWQYIPLGKTGVSLQLTVNTQADYVGVDLFIANNKELFEKLETHKTKIEKELGELEWVNNASVKSARIRKTKNSIITELNKEDITQHIELAKTFKATFSKYL